MRRFSIGTLVEVAGITGIFEVRGYHQNIYHAQGRTIEVNRYELQNYETKAFINGYIDELVLQPAKNISISKSDFDLLLDEYNDLMRLYDEFQDESYLEEALKLNKSLHKYKVY